MGCFLLYHLYPFTDFFLSKLIDSLERWHPREAFILAKRNILAKLPSSRSDKSSRSVFSSSFHQVLTKNLPP